MKATAKGGQGTTEASAIPNNLPRYLTSFVGRVSELRGLKSLLASSRMVTLTGPGGAGKTRLVVRLAGSSADRWPDGIWWVELAPLSDARQVAGNVLAALKLPGRGAALDLVTTWLAGKQALLILDNCEHLVAACAEFCQAALERCPELTIIATSREPLGVPGEAQWLVPAMDKRDAVSLFEERGRLVLADFKVDTANRDPVSNICSRLDGLPLAIEMAAARVGMMTEPEILSQLDDRFQMLKGGIRTAPPRQQTMFATIDWSYRLLTDEEALLFRRLTVFRGGFTLESAQAVCADRIAMGVLGALSALVQKSMVVAEGAADSGTRYRLQESQLAYAEERLREAGELEITRRRHYEYFRDCLDARTWNPTLARPHPGLAELQWKAHETGNLWAAMGWARNNADDLGLSLAADLASIRFGDGAHARRLLADLLDRSPERGMARFHALRLFVGLAVHQGDNEAALRSADAALALARELGDIEVLALALTVAGIPLCMSGELDAAEQMNDEATALLRGSSNLPLATVIRNNVGWLKILRGDYIAARGILVECVTSADSDESKGSYLDSLAWSQWGLNDHQNADASFKESLATAQRFMNHMRITDCLQGLLSVAGAKGNDERALRLAAAVYRLSGEWSLRSEPWIEMQAEETQSRSRSRLGKRKSEDAWKQGWAMTLDQAIDYALAETEPETMIDTGPLTRREQEIARLVAAGKTNRQIADQLFIVERSAEGHLARIRHKLGVRSRTEIAMWAVEHGLAGGADTAEKQKGGTPAESPSRARLRRN